MKKKFIIICFVFIMCVFLFLLCKYTNIIWNIQMIFYDMEEESWRITDSFYSGWEKLKDYSKTNNEILKKIRDKNFWDEKINERINKENCKNGFDVKTIWYWLLCDGYYENLKDCTYSTAISCKTNEKWYTGYSVHWQGSSYSRWWFSYDLAVNQIAMNDIWNWWVFYSVSYRNHEDLKQKYLSDEFRNNYTGDYRSIGASQLITDNGDWTAYYHLYIVTEEWDIVYKSSTKIISKETARNIIADDIKIDPAYILYISFNPEKNEYHCDFSLKWHTYNYVVNAIDWTIINWKDDMDIWRNEAIRMALDDAGIKDKDLWKKEDDSCGECISAMYLDPHVQKQWDWKNALYEVSISTNKDRYYVYQIQVTNGKFISKQITEKYIISDKIWNGNNENYVIQSVNDKNLKYNISLSDLDMDDIFDFKDLIYLWVTFESDNIMDWSVIDRESDKNLGKITKDELDNVYSFESHYEMREMNAITWGDIYLSNLEENIIYKYSIAKWNNYMPKVVNDLWIDTIVYVSKEYAYSKDKKIKYTAKPYLEYWYPRLNTNSYGGTDWLIYKVMYKKATSEELLKLIDSKEITLLSKYEVWEEMDRWYDESYLYNDTDNIVTVLISDEVAKDRWVDDMKIDIEPWKFVACSNYVDSVVIIDIMSID